MEPHDENVTDLTRLSAVLEETLSSTTRTKETLYLSFVGAKKLAGNWFIPDTSDAVEPSGAEYTRDVEEEDSTIGEIAKSIDQVVEYAQTLRKKLSPCSQIQTKKAFPASKTNKGVLLSSKAKQTSNNSSRVQKAVNKSLKENEALKEDSRHKETSESNNIARKSASRLPVSHTYSSDSKCQIPMRKNSSPMSLNNGRCNKKSFVRPQSKSTSSLQTTYQKDFAVQPVQKYSKFAGSLFPSRLKNKESTSTNNSPKQQTINKTESKEKGNECSKFNLISKNGKIDIAGLEDLLNKVTNYPSLNKECEDTKITPQKEFSCKLLGEERTQKTSYRPVGLEEAIDVLGVPPDLVKVLKSYHSYLSAKTPYITSKGQATAHSFANRLTSMNSARWKSMDHEPLAGLLSEYVSLTAETSRIFQNSSQDTNGTTLSNFQKESEKLEMKFRKWSNTDESVTTNLHSLNSAKKLATAGSKKNLIEGWDLIGIWNVKSRQRVEAFNKLRCITYNNEARCKKFSAILQTIQRLELQMEVFDVVEKTIFPQMMKYKMQDPTFIIMFKLAVVLCNMTSLRSPVIIKEV